MKRPNEPIDRELRTAARLLKVMVRPSLWYFKLVRRLGRSQIGKAPPGVELDQVWAKAAPGGKKVRICIFRPLDHSATDDLPLVVYFHGGGYAMGNPEGAGDIIRRLIEARPCVVIAPDYRKSLDEPYPAAIDDCYGALVWADSHREVLGANQSPIALLGHSAGGGLALAASLRARDLDGPEIAFLMPIYPMIDDRMKLPSSRDNRAPVWNTRSNRLGWALYLGNMRPGAKEIPSDAAPARAQDLTRLPPTATMVGSLDPFRDETESLVRRLRGAGVKVKFEGFEGAFHASELFAPKAKISRQANRFFLRAFCEGIDRNFGSWSADPELPLRSRSN